MQLPISNPAGSGFSLLITNVSEGPSRTVLPGESFTIDFEDGAAVFEIELGGIAADSLGAAVIAQGAGDASVSGSTAEIQTRVDANGAPAPTPPFLSGHGPAEIRAIEDAGLDPATTGVAAVTAAAPTPTFGAGIGHSTEGDTEALASQTVGGGSGEDSLSGTDTLTAADSVEVGAATDTIDAGLGDDSLNGGEAQEFQQEFPAAIEGAATDTIDAGTGDDAIHVGEESAPESATTTTVFGGEAGDTLDAGLGNDTVEGGAATETTATTATTAADAAAAPPADGAESTTGAAESTTDTTAPVKEPEQAPEPVEVHPDTAAAQTDSPIPVQPDVLNPGEPREPSDAEVLTVMAALHTAPSIEKTASGRIQLTTVNQALKAHGFTTIDAKRRDDVQDANPGDE